MPQPPLNCPLSRWMNRSWSIQLGERLLALLRFLL
jgi:hypothetical protein